MAKKPSPETQSAQKRQDREARRLAKAAALPPIPSTGGTFVVTSAGDLAAAGDIAGADPAPKET